MSVARARLGAVERQRLVVRALGFLEQARGPRRISIERHRARPRVVGAQPLRGAARAGEVPRAQQRDDEPRVRFPANRRIVGRRRDRAAVRFDGVAVARLVHEQVAELELNVRGRGRGNLREQQERKRRQDGYHTRDSRHGGSSAPHYSKPGAGGIAWC